MTRYSKEFKDSIIKQMMPPTNKSVNQLTAETGVSEHTPYTHGNGLLNQLVLQPRPVNHHQSAGQVKINF